MLNISWHEWRALIEKTLKQKTFLPRLTRKKCLIVLRTLNHEKRRKTALVTLMPSYNRRKWMYRSKTSEQNFIQSFLPEFLLLWISIRFACPTVYEYDSKGEKNPSDIQETLLTVHSWELFLFSSAKLCHSSMLHFSVLRQFFIFLFWCSTNV